MRCRQGPHLIIIWPSPRLRYEVHSDVIGEQTNGLLAALHYHGVNLPDLSGEGAGQVSGEGAGRYAAVTR